MKTLVTFYFQPTKCLIKRPTFCLLGKVFAFSCQAKTRILFALERTQAFLQSGVRPIFVCAHARIHRLFKFMEIRYSLKTF